MAKRITLIDDWTGEEIEEGDLAPASERRITYNGEIWELDLSNSSAKLVQEILAPIRDKASIVRATPGRRKEESADVDEVVEEAADEYEAADVDLASYPGQGTNYQKHTVEQRRVIREWARNNDFETTSAGYVPTAAVTAFYEAHQ